MAMDMEVRAVPLAGRVITTLLLVATVSALVFCLTRRLSAIANWKELPIPGWLIVAIYADSMVFVLSTAVLEKGFNLNNNYRICDAASILCLACYMSTKILIYYFLIEKIYIIRNPWTPRRTDKLYLFNLFGLLLPYIVLVSLAFLYRISQITHDGKCMIGIEQRILGPLTGCEFFLNVYLTSLFLAPLRKLYSFQNGSNNHRLRKMATRTFIGSCATLTATVANLGTLAGLDGEAGWVCLMLCNLDVLFAVLVLHWATSLDANMKPKGAAGHDNSTDLEALGASSTPTSISNEDLDRIVLNPVDQKVNGDVSNIAVDEVDQFDLLPPKKNSLDKLNKDKDDVAARRDSRT